MLINLLKAFGFLKIKYREKEQNLNLVLYVLPLLLSILVLVFLTVVNLSSTNHVNVFTQKSFDSISTFVQVLPGFYIASLAAIASYNNSDIDNKMSNNPPYLEEKTGGSIRPSELSRRRFLTLMFGYLAAVSMISTVFLFFARLGYDAAIIPVSLITYNIVYYFICLVFFTTFFQMILVTLYGIYYLADRMHRP